MSDILYTPVEIWISDFEIPNPQVDFIHLYLKTDKIFYLKTNSGDNYQVSLPISFNNNDSIYYNGTNWVATSNLKIYSTEIVINESGSSTVDFRVEGGTESNLLFIDSSVDAIGIKTNAPNSNSSIDIGGIKPIILPRLTTTQRNNITPTAGMVCFNTTVNAMQYYVTSNWMDVGSSSPATTNIKTINTTPYTILSTDYILLLDATGLLTMTLTLPAVPTHGQEYIFKCTGNLISLSATISGNGKSIDGGNSIALLTSSYNTRRIVFDSEKDKWFIINLN